MSIVKKFGLWLLANVIPFALVGFIAAQIGWYQGYRAGATGMRDTFMCFLDRTSGSTFGGWRNEYCQRLGVDMKKRADS